MLPLTIWGVARELWPYIKDVVKAILEHNPSKASKLAVVAALRAADLELMRRQRAGIK